MDNRVHEIKNLEIKIKEIQLDADSHFKTLGEFVAENETGEYHELIKKKKLAPVISEYKKLSARFEEAEAKKEKLLQFRKKVAELNDAIRQTLKKNSEIEKDNEKHYIGISEALYTLFKKNPASMAELELYFSGITELDKKNRELERKIQSVGGGSGQSLLSRIIGAGEKTILYSRRKINSALMLSAYKSAGKRMCEDRIYESSGSQEITGMFAAYRSNRKIQEDLELRIETLDAEKSNFDRNIEEILQEFGIDPDLYIKSVLREKEEYLKEFGKNIFTIITAEENKTGDDKGEFLDQNSESLDLIEGIKKSLIEINELEERADQLRRELEIERLENQIKEQKKFIEKKTLKINELEKEIKELNSLIIAEEERIIELKNAPLNS